MLLEVVDAIPALPDKYGKLRNRTDKVIAAVGFSPLIESYRKLFALKDMN